MLAQLAKILEKEMRKHFFTNPLDIPDEEQSVGARAKQDRTVLDKLILGQGISKTKPVEFPAQHIRSWHSITQEGKRMRTLDPTTLNVHMMTRVHQVAEVIDCK